jgi:hypothetical protein
MVAREEPEKLPTIEVVAPIEPGPARTVIKQEEMTSGLEVKDNVILVKGLDMPDGTPILDLKPFVPPPPEA